MKITFIDQFYLQFRRFQMQIITERHLGSSMDIEITQEKMTKVVISSKIMQKMKPNGEESGGEKEGGEEKGYNSPHQRPK